MPYTFVDSPSWVYVPHGSSHEVTVETHVIDRIKSSFLEGLGELRYGRVQSVDTPIVFDWYTLSLRQLADDLVFVDDEVGVGFGPIVIDSRVHLPSTYAALAKFVLSTK